MNSSATTSTLSILLVEDSPLDGRLLMEALRPAIQAGEVVVQTVKRLSAAVAELERVRFSCVLLDLGLPDGQGLDNVRTLREIDGKAAIVVLTGLDDERLAGEALRLGAQDYVVKGETDGEMLMKRIRRAVQRNRQTLELEQQRAGSFFAASRDPLTLLPNQPLFLDRARIQLAEARRGGREFGLACLRLDGVEEARSQYGGLVADDLLRRLAELMGETLRGSDSLGRLDSQQFGLILYPLDEPGALVEAVHRIVARVAALRHVGNCAVQPRLRAGLAVFAGGAESAEDLLERAARIASALPATGNGVAGLDHNEPAALPYPAVAVPIATPECRWQPWVDGETGACAGVEMMAAWGEAAEPGLGGLEADPQASAESSLVAAQCLLRQWRSWNEAGFKPDCLAFNLPAAALRGTDFAARLHALFLGAGLSAEQLQLEIQESAFRQLREHRQALLSLQSDGYRLVLDSEGSIELSLAQISQIPLAGIKLGRPLLRQLLEENLQGGVRRYISALQGAAQALGMTVIANGVESPEMLAALRMIGLRWLQGDRLVPPLEAHLVPVQWSRPVRVT
ncbi:MAG: EAL domain-containing protein [Stagnimonas sp.]|nr:EAL domain-containing protein [Stagnimonas sp.]